MANIDEDRAFQEEVAAVKKWWSDSRWRYTKRPFTAEQIVAKRGTISIQYPGNVLSKKLWNILEGRFKNKEASFTYGCLDPVMVTQMAKYLDTVYVSGWQSSSTASSTDEPGPDLADYPYVCSFCEKTTARILISYRPLCPTRSSTCSWLSSSTTGSSVRSASPPPRLSVAMLPTLTSFVPLLPMPILAMVVSQPL